MCPRVPHVVSQSFWYGELWDTWYYSILTNHNRWTIQGQTVVVRSKSQAHNTLLTCHFWKSKERPVANKNVFCVPEFPGLPYYSKECGDETTWGETSSGGKKTRGRWEFLGGRNDYGRKWFGAKWPGTILIGKTVVRITIFIGTTVVQLASAEWKMTISATCF